MNYFTKTFLATLTLINMACQSQENSLKMNREHVPCYVNIYPALKNPQEVYYLILDGCPNGVEKLEKLQYLYFGPCKFTEDIMKGITSLKNVQEFSFYECSIDKLFFSQYQNQNITFLNLAFSQINNVEESVNAISRLSSLKTLGLSLTNIPYFHESLLQLKKLRSVYLGNDTSLFDFDISFKNLSKLEALSELAINSSDIKIFPKSFQSLRNLKRLDVYDCPNTSLVYILNEIKDWEQLNFLGYGGTTLKILPIDLVSFQNLKAIDISDNKDLDLKQALGVISKIEGLEELNLSYCVQTNEENMMGKLDDLAKLKNLKKLEMVHNRYINEIYLWNILGQLVNLEEINLTETPSYLQSDIYRLTKLRNLNITFTGMPMVDSIDRFPSSLEELKFAKSNLKFFPPQIISTTGLKSVNLQDNEIIEIPTEISSLSELFHLDLSYNKIVNLPESIKELKGSLRYLNLMGNPIGEIPERKAEVMKWLPDTEIFWGQ